MKPPTEARHTPLRVEIDVNATPRLYRGNMYIGVASQREIELCAERDWALNSHASLLSACEAALEWMGPLFGMNAEAQIRRQEIQKQLRTALASARKEGV